MSRSSVQLRLACAVALVLAVLLGFWATLGHGFTRLDDPAYVVANPVVQRGLTAAGVRYAWTSTEMGNRHPFTWLSSMPDAERSGGSARALLARVGWVQHGGR